MAVKTAFPQMSTVKYDVTTLRGGLDQKTPTLALPPSFCREAVNYECSVTGGYSRIGGYERFDGRLKPSDAIFAIVQVVSFINMPTVGQTITGFTSAATGKIVLIDTTDNYMVLTQLTGTFTALELLQVGATSIGINMALTLTLTPLQNAVYTNLAADVYRALITAVPGSGPVRGVVSAIFAGVHEVYAFRNNAGGTAGVLHRATASGWTPVAMLNQVTFTNGSGASTPVEGDTLTQGANTTLVRRIVLLSGSWAAGTAQGYFVINPPAPGALVAGAATVAAYTVTLGGANTVQAFLPGGHYEFDIGNFSGQLSTERIYGASGVDYCFEFDGTVVVFIHTGAPVDKPTHIKVHHKHLMVSIGSSLMGSGVGAPYVFSALAGGFEIAVGDTITCLLIQPGNQDKATMAVFQRNHTGMLYGTTSANFEFISFTSATGAYDYMGQNLSQSYVLDDRGLMNFRAAQEFGNFQQATLTQNIQPFIDSKQGLAACSAVSKDRSQYRAFFSDGSGVYATTVNGKFLGAIPVFFPNALFCAWNGELASGADVSYAGAAAGGMVYQLDRGSSFDGAAIDASLTLNWNPLKTPRTRKRFRKGSLEVQGNNYAEISFGYTLGYLSQEIDQPTAQSYETHLGGTGVWDVSSWDDFFWDGRTLEPTEVEVNGRAENIQVTLASTTDIIYPYTVHSLILHYSPGRGLR